MLELQTNLSSHAGRSLMPLVARVRTQGFRDRSGQLCAIVIAIALACSVQIRAGQPKSRDTGRSSAAVEWWAYRPLVRPAVPETKNTRWSNNPIDLFVL